MSFQSDNSEEYIGVNRNGSTTVSRTASAKRAKFSIEAIDDVRERVFVVSQYLLHIHSIHTCSTHAHTYIIVHDIHMHNLIPIT